MMLGDHPLSYARLVTVRADHVRPGGQFRRLHAVSPAACEH